MKIIRITALLIAMLSSVVAASAAEPLVQEGKLWKHSISTNWTSYWYNSENTMFFGSPEELYGKTYFPVKDTDTDRVYAYMRQDGGKVYILVDGTIYEQLYYYQDDTEVSLAPGDEVLAYDFDAKPGDSYISASSGDMGVNYGKGVYGIEDIVEVTVDAVDTVVVNGTERKRQKVHIGDKSHQYTIVDGIGANEGLFFVPEYGPFTTGNGAQFARIKEVTDAEGNVLFTKADFDAPAYRPLVQEGKAWSQISYKRFEDSGRYGKIWLPEMYFEGKCERNGKEYSVLRTSPNDVLALMRQEGGKVYLLIDENFIGRYNIVDWSKPETDDPEEYIGKEYLVYDFDAKKGDEFIGIFYCVANDVIYLNMGLDVYDVDEISVNGQNLRRFDISCCGFVVEGYGAQNGNCLIPQFIECCAGHDHYCDPELRMHHIIDRATREEIFTYEDFSKPSVGVEEIPAEQPSDGVQAKPKDNKMYDLNGREIRTPLPGTVYILNGEKHVAK